MKAIMKDSLLDFVLGSLVLFDVSRSMAKIVLQYIILYSRVGSVVLMLNSQLGIARLQLHEMNKNHNFISKVNIML
jgi:hypothetical protein